MRYYYPTTKAVTCSRFYRTLSSPCDYFGLPSSPNYDIQTSWESAIGPEAEPDALGIFVANIREVLQLITVQISVPY